MTGCRRGHDASERYRTTSGTLRCRACNRITTAAIRRRAQGPDHDPMVTIPEQVRDALARLDATSDPGDLARRIDMKPERLRAVIDGRTLRTRSRVLDRMVCAAWLVGTVDVMTGEVIA